MELGVSESISSGPECRGKRRLFVYVQSRKHSRFQTVTASDLQSRIEECFDFVFLHVWF